MAPRKAAPPKAPAADESVVEVPPKVPRAGDITWTKRHELTDYMAAYLGDHPNFRLKLFSDSVKEASAEGRKKTTAKDNKSALHGVLAEHIFKICLSAEDPWHIEYLVAPGRFGTAVGSRLAK